MVSDVTSKPAVLEVLMLRVAIIGCGKIADSHAEQIGRIAGCRIVGVCDRESLMARQLYERYPVDAYFDDARELFAQSRPDVVHITTPPESHFNLAIRCLEAGCHVYVEKPFTLYEADARRLIDLAVSRGLRVTVGHDDQFSHVARRMRGLVRGGFLGGNPVHMESYYCYEIGQSAYATALLSDQTHWVRRLPGKLLQNIISHGIARITEFLTTESPSVLVHGHISRRLKELGEREIVDELRVIISENEHTTAYFTFSSQMRPALHQFRIYGPSNGLILDQDQETLIALKGVRSKSYLETFATPLTLAKQYCSNVFTNARTFLGKDFHAKSGMKYLIESFYASVTGDAPPPIPYREIILTARIMDSIFGQLAARSERSNLNQDEHFESESSVAGIGAVTATHN
jgi:predicted dehydrogenase